MSFLALIDGDDMTADDAAWAELAATAERALKLPGLSESCAARMVQMSEACRRLAGSPSVNGAA